MENKARPWPRFDKLISLSRLFDKSNKKEVKIIVFLGGGADPKVVLKNKLQRKPQTKTIKRMILCQHGVFYSVRLALWDWAVPNISL